MITLTHSIVGLLCSGSVCLISVTSSYLYKKDSTINSEVMSIISFLPCFFYSTTVIHNHTDSIQLSLLISLLIKNTLYCLSFYLRYESLKKFGPFIGSLILGAQPILTFMLGFFILKEEISWLQSLSIIFLTGALFTILKPINKNENKISISDFIIYYLFPAIVSACTLIWDRYFLFGKIPEDDFFILDRLIVLPTFLFSLWLIKRNSIFTTEYIFSSLTAIKKNWKPLLIIAIFFSISAYSYNLFLKIEKAAIVGLFRNLAYPIAALIGVFTFKQKISMTHWLSFTLIIISILLATKA